MHDTVHRVSDLSGKRIVDQTSGKEIATIKELLLDANGHHVTAILIDTGGLFGGKQRAIRWQSVMAVGDVMVVEGPAPIIDITDDAEIDELLKLNRRISGMAIISEATGENLGSVSDVVVNERGQVLGYDVGGGFLSGGKRGFMAAEYVRTIGKDAVITTAARLMHETEREHGRPNETGGFGPDATDVNRFPMGYEDHERERE